jgi:hypothetical protein
MLDDNDIMSALKLWQNNNDKVLAILSSCILDRKLLRIEVSDTPFSQEIIDTLKEKQKDSLKLSTEEMDYFVFTDHVSNSTYKTGGENINIIYKDGTTKDISLASDMLDHTALSKPVSKYILCYPK